MKMKKKTLISCGLQSSKYSTHMHNQ